MLLLSWCIQKDELKRPWIEASETMSQNTLSAFLLGILHRKGKRLTQEALGRTHHLAFISFYKWLNLRIMVSRYCDVFQHVSDCPAFPWQGLWFTSIGYRGEPIPSLFFVMESNTGPVSGDEDVDVWVASSLSCLPCPVRLPCKTSQNATFTPYQLQATYCHYLNHFSQCQFWVESHPHLQICRIWKYFWSPGVKSLRWRL